MAQVFGSGNGFVEYALVLLTYAALFVVVMQIQRRLPSEQRKTLIVLFVALGVIGFSSNYILFLLGVMSFLPWFNNFIHTFLWIGLVLSYVFLAVYRRPVWEQFVLFAIFSFVVKLAEHQLLGTWEMDNFFGIQWHTAYMLGWSLFDGLIPIGIKYGLRLASRYVSGLIET